MCARFHLNTVKCSINKVVIAKMQIYAKAKETISDRRGVDSKPELREQIDQS